MVSTRKPAASPSRAGRLPLTGGALACNFANTSSGRGTLTHQEHLRCGDDVLAWAVHAGVLSGTDGTALARRLTPDRSRALFRRALALREDVHAVLRSIALGESPQLQRLEGLHRAYARCVARAHLLPKPGGFEWVWNVVEQPVEAVLGPISASGVKLLIEADHTRIKLCQGNACGWVFLDTTKNHSRRWCEMEVCGNRAKQRRRRSNE